MNKPLLVAVGSNQLVAQEIAGIAQSFVGKELSVITKLTDEVKGSEPDVFYICATTQGKKLQAVIPAGQLFIFDLHPTTKFFLDIARIPAGKTVSVFNNLLPYTELLTKECCELGLGDWQFEPIAFEEMDRDEVRRRLRRTHWIVGAEPFMGQGALLSSAYKGELPADVTIISGHRMASVASAGKLLAALAAYYRKDLFQRYQGLMAQVPETELAAQQLLSRFDGLTGQVIKTVQFLQDAALESIKQQIGSAAQVVPADEPVRMTESSYSLEQARSTAKTQLHPLKWLQDRLELLAKS